MALVPASLIGMEYEVAEPPQRANTPCLIDEDWEDVEWEELARARRPRSNSESMISESMISLKVTPHSRKGANQLLPWIRGVAHTAGLPLKRVETPPLVLKLTKETAHNDHETDVPTSPSSSKDCSYDGSWCEQHSPESRADTPRTEQQHHELVTSENWESIRQVSDMVSAENGLFAQHNEQLRQYLDVAQPTVRPMEGYAGGSVILVPFVVPTTHLQQHQQHQQLCAPPGCFVPQPSPFAVMQGAMTVMPPRQEHLQLQHPAAWVSVVSLPPQQSAWGAESFVPQCQAFHPPGTRVVLGAVMNTAFMPPPTTTYCKEPPLTISVAPEGINWEAAGASEEQQATRQGVKATRSKQKSRKGEGACKRLSPPTGKLSLPTGKQVQASLPQSTTGRWSDMCQTPTNTSNSTDDVLGEVHGRTTVMMRNIPNIFTRANFVELLNKQGFSERYNFVYLPIDFKSRKNLGYAFVNLVSTQATMDFWDCFQGFTAWDLNSPKICEINWTEPKETFEGIVERFRDSAVMHEIVPDECKPIMLEGGDRVPFPAPTKRIRPPRNRHVSQKTSITAAS